VKKHEYKIEMEMKLSRGGDSNNPISLCVYPKPTLGLPSAYVSWSFLSLIEERSNKKSTNQCFAIESCD
jgi:hypothetical protein